MKVFGNKMQLEMRVESSQSRSTTCFSESSLVVLQSAVIRRTVDVSSCGSAEVYVLCELLEQAEVFLQEFPASCGSISC